MEENQKISDANKVDFSKVGPIQGGKSVDLTKYDKKEVTLEFVEVTQVPSQYTELIEGTEQHHFQWVLKVSSQVLETIGEGEDIIQFKASELFNLIQDKKGNLTGFPTGEGSNLMKFCKDIGIKNADEFKSLQEVMDAIKGKKSLVKVYDKEVDGKTKTFMKFRY
jgi:hypothetical protein